MEQATRSPTSEAAVAKDEHRRGFMQHIVVDDSQAKLITEATGTVEIRDARGKHLGYVLSAHVITNEDIAIAKERLASDAPRHTTQQVLDRLRSLEQK
jgi:hypothetical protein